MAIFNLAWGVEQCVHFGLASDTKPAGEADGHVFFEIDTGKVFRVESSVWTEKTTARILTAETPSGTVNDSNLTFTVNNQPLFINVNGLHYPVGKGIYVSYSSGTITLNTPIGTDGFIISYYNA